LQGSVRQGVKGALKLAFRHAYRIHNGPIMLQAI
jgi:hypothetical protein